MFLIKFAQCKACHSSGKEAKGPMGGSLLVWLKQILNCIHRELAACRLLRGRLSTVDESTSYQPLFWTNATGQGNGLLRHSVQKLSLLPTGCNDYQMKGLSRGEHTADTQSWGWAQTAMSMRRRPESIQPSHLFAGLNVCQLWPAPNNVVLSHSSLPFCPS